MNLQPFRILPQKESKIMALVFALLLSSVLSGCAATSMPQTPGTPSPVVNQNTALTTNPEYSLESLNFIDEQTGWLVRNPINQTTSKSEIYTTSDAGTTWKKVSELSVRAQRLKFIDKTSGWAIAQASIKAVQGITKGSYEVLHTTDGGKTWAVQWQESNNGSETALGTSAAASANKPITPESGTAANCDLWLQATQGFALIGTKLLTTQDGGQHWSEVTLRSDFYPQQMSFVTADKGWVIGNVSGKDPAKQEHNQLAVLSTSDGGKHWQQQFTKTYSAGPVGSVDIFFLNSTTGWFLTSNLGTFSGDLYYTTDGGKSWKKINEINCARPTPTQIEFVSPQVGMLPLDVGAGPIAGGILRTRDGGKTFNLVTAEAKVTSVSELDFISPQQAWAVAGLGPQGDYLLRTTDGGETWIQIFPK